MKSVTIAEASEKLSELFDAALRGEEIIITKGDLTSIKLTPTTTVKSRRSTFRGDLETTTRQPGSAKGQIWMSSDFDEPLEDFKDYM